jgi:4-hydroxy-tetrahydrodipicolinate synthase
VGATSIPGRFGAVLTAMVTPFDGDGALDLDAAVSLARWLVEQGNDGLVVAGTTGEAPVLTDAEKLDLWRAVSEAVTVPVIAGAGSNDTRHTVELVAEVGATGAAGVLLVGPYYSRPAQAGIEAHFRAAAAATDLPVMLYDVPARTGRRMARDVLVRLFTEVPNIVAFKDATGDPAAAAGLVAELGSAMELYSGDDSMTLPLLAVGAVGVVGVASHWCAREFSEMIAAFAKGDVELAREVNARMLESFVFENTELSPYSVSAKAMMRTLGLRVGECRLPNGPTPDGVEDRARQVYQRLRAHG